MKKFLLMMALLLSPAPAQANESTDCRIFNSSVTCDDGTDYRIFNGAINGPDGERYTLSKNPIGDDGKSIDGDYTTSDGTKIRVSHGTAKVEYSDSVLRERKERKERRKKQKAEFDRLLGRNDPVKVDVNGFFE